MREQLSVQDTLGSRLNDADFRISQLEDYNIIRSPEWIEKQPFSQMPYAVDEVSGLVIFESRAIAKCESETFPA